jgi:hypothetical protein
MTTTSHACAAPSVPALSPLCRLVSAAASAVVALSLTGGVDTMFSAQETASVPAALTAASHAVRPAA